MGEHKLLERITVNPQIFGGKPIIRGRRLAVEHVLGMLAAGIRWTRYSAATRGLREKTSRPALSMRDASPPTNELSPFPSR